MTSTYRSRAQDHVVADDFLRDHLPCTVCGAATERETLTNYGARCGRCYTQYLTGGRRAPPMPSKERRLEILAGLKAAFGTNRQDPKAWAKKLREDEQAGVRLSKAQAEAWRAALKGAA